MRKTVFIAASLAAAVSSAFIGPSSFADEGEQEPYTSEIVVYSQRRLVMAPKLVRPELAFFVGEFGGNDTVVGIGVQVDWTPIDKLVVGALAAPRLSPDTAAGDPMLYVRYQLLEGAFQLAVHGAYTFTDPGPGSFHLGVPLRLQLNPAARLDITPLADFNLPKSGDSNSELTVDLNLLFSLGVSLTRAIYIDLTTGLVIPEVDFDRASIPLGLELGYSIKGGEKDAFIDIFLRARFDAFLLPNAPAGSDTVNLDVWSIALGGRVHFGLE